MKDTMPPVIYNVGLLREAFIEVKIERVKIMAHEPLPNCARPLAQPCLAKQSAVNVTLSLEALKNFKDTDFIGLSAAPEELAGADKKGALPFHTTYDSKDYTIMSSQQAQETIDRVFDAYQPAVA